MLTAYLCRFCGERIVWGEIVRILRTDPGQPGWQLNESYAHFACLRAAIRPEIALTFHRHWNGKRPLPDDSADLIDPADPERVEECARCARPMTPAKRVHLRLQRPAGTVKAPEFDEQSLAMHFDCLAEVSTSRLF